MAFVAKDSVLETTTTTGTGNITLAGAVAGFRTFSSVMTSPSDTCYYTIEGVDGSGIPTGEWETGEGTYSAANTLTRTNVFNSSNAGALVTFSSGTKRVGMEPSEKSVAAPGGGGVLQTATKTANYTAAEGELVVCNTSGGAFTITLPPHPTSGARVGVYLATAGNTLTVARNGRQLDGGTVDATISAAETLRVWQWSWRKGTWETVQATGQSILGSNYSISANDVYQDTGLSVVLPVAGVYSLHWDVRAHFKYASNATTDVVSLLCELFDATASAAITDSERGVASVLSAGTIQQEWWANSAFRVQVSVTQATTVKLYAQRAQSVGTVNTWTTSSVDSGSGARTVLGYQKLG